MPEIVSMENVPNLVNEGVFNDFVNALIEQGYHVEYQVVYCPEYGFHSIYLSQQKFKQVL